VAPEIITINYGNVNCYLIRTGDRCILIDTGLASRRAEVEKELESQGCEPGSLKLILITHGDYDHSGNASYLRNKFGASIAMHPAESAAVENGDMLLSRNRMAFWKRILAKVVIPFIMHLGTFERFKPDLYLKDGNDISGYGLNGKIWHIPGHSRGSIGILTDEGDLFCGDLLVGGEKPALNSLIDDPAEANASIEKLAGLKINTVYPGHGRPFPMSMFIALLTSAKA
jgi:hydroxyacylglutathione hydrolase